MSREDWQYAVKIPIGALPGGSGNALYQSILYESKLVFTKRYHNSVINQYFCKCTVCHKYIIIGGVKHSLAFHIVRYSSWFSVVLLQIILKSYHIKNCVS